MQNSGTIYLIDTAQDVQFFLLHKLYMHIFIHNNYCLCMESITCIYFTRTVIKDM